MTRWMLALLFAFGTVSFLSACEEKSDAEKVGDEVEENIEKAQDELDDVEVPEVPSTE